MNDQVPNNAKIGLLVTDPEGYYNGLDRDLPHLLPAFKESGIDVVTLSWHDKSVRWTDYDLVVVKSPWDYSDHYNEFMDWLSMAGNETRILNAPDLIRWNIDKVYLSEIQSAGIPCLDFTFCQNLSETKDTISAYAASISAVVIKPTVSAGSKDTGLFMVDDPLALELAERIFAEDKTVMVMPEAKYISDNGENALFFFNGKYAFSFHKGAILLPGGKYIGGQYTENITRGYPTEPEIKLGENAVAAVGEIAKRHGFSEDATMPLYARADIGINNNGEPELIEIELFEPSLFVDIVPEAIPKYEAAILSRLG